MKVHSLGPYEEEDLDVDVILKGEPPDLAERDIRIYRRLRDAGFNVLIGYDVLEEEPSEEA